MLSAIALGTDVPDEAPHTKPLLEGEAGPAPMAPLMPNVGQKHLPPLDWEEVYILYSNYAENAAYAQCVSQT